MVTYTLTYFNVRGRAEVARLILHYAQVPFEDRRIIDKSEWPQMKAQMPFGQVPVLEVDGKVLAESYSICRYLAQRHGLAGKSDWEQALVDMYGDCCRDIIFEMRPVKWEKDAEKRKDVFIKLNSEKVQPHLKKIEEQLSKNGTGFLVGDSITWADLAYYSFLAPMGEMFGEDVVLGCTPRLKNLCDHIGNIPQIKKYVESRPKTDV